MSIEFTQYLRPAGKPRPMLIDRPVQIETKASCLKHLGYRFDIEELTDGKIFMEVSHPMDDQAISNRVCKNNAEVATAVDSLIREAFRFAEVRGKYRPGANI
jgi:hypothetical protein